MKKHLITQTNRTIETFKSVEIMGKECVIVYYNNEFAIFDFYYNSKKQFTSYGPEANKSSSDEFIQIILELIEK